MTPSILWLTGLPASGKTAIAEAVCTELTVHHDFGTLLLDGDELRKGLCADLGLDRFSRRENARRAAHLARLVANYALRHAVVSLISPYREDREMARKIAGKTPFVEVWVATPLSVCSQRDPKGLYRRARMGELKGLTGVDDPYEAPLNPEVVVDTTVDTAHMCAAKIVAALNSRGR